MPCGWIAGACKNPHIQNTILILAIAVICGVKWCLKRGGPKTLKGAPANHDEALMDLVY